MTRRYPHCGHGWSDDIDCNICSPHQSFQPDWRLDPPDALAIVLRIVLHRHGVEFGCNLETDEQWIEMCEEIITMMGDGISPMKLVELPRPWDAPKSTPTEQELAAIDAALAAPEV